MPHCKNDLFELHKEIKKPAILCKSCNIQLHELGYGAWLLHNSKCSVFDCCNVPDQIQYHFQEYMWREVHGKAIDKGITRQLLFGGPITHTEKSTGFGDAAAHDSGVHEQIQACVHKHTNMLCANAQALLPCIVEERDFPLKSLSRAHITSLEEWLAHCSGAHTSGDYFLEHVALGKAGDCQSVFWFDS